MKLLLNGITETGFESRHLVFEFCIFDVHIFVFVPHLIHERIHSRYLLIDDGLDRCHERHIFIICHLFDVKLVLVHFLLQLFNGVGDFGRFDVSILDHIG